MAPSDAALRFTVDGRLSLWAVTVLLGAGCGPSSSEGWAQNHPAQAPKPVAQPALEGHDEDSTPAPTPGPEPGVPAMATGSCQLEVRTTMQPVAGGRAELVVYARNTTGAALSLTLAGRCPGGPARFQGLTPDYDYGALCQQGACAGGPTTRQVLALAAGAQLEVARVMVDPAGDACNAALPDGRYTIGATLDVTGASVCHGEKAVLAAAGAPAPNKPVSPATPRERCPAMACAYVPCPPGVPPPTGCSAVCGCAGMRGTSGVQVQPQ